MSTDIIIFSKNRTLQLKSLILSMLHYTDIEQKSINVLYTSDIDSISYESLIEEFPDINFIKEKNFLTDLKTIVKESDSEYFEFMVDDLIFRAECSYKDVEVFLAAHSDVDSFCPRMGKNIQVTPKPELKEYEEGFIGWDTSEELGAEWNYAWDMSSSLYRRNLVEDYLSKCRDDKETFPNPFEDHFYQCIPNTRPHAFPWNILCGLRFLFRKRYMRIFAYPETVAFTQAVNGVATIDHTVQETFSPEGLHRKMNEGYIVDYFELKDVLPPHPNMAGEFFYLTKIKDTNERISKV